MALRFRILPMDDTRPAGRAAAGPPVAREVELPEDLAEVRIGRRPDLELSLPFAVLSGVHARVIRAGDARWEVEDAASTNGTWLAGERLAPGERRSLAPGAELCLADVRLRFDGPGPARPASEGTATIARRLVDDLFGVDAGAPTISVALGAPPASLALVALGRPYVVGRADGSALALSVEEVSREHAAFVRGPDGVLVRDLGSKNGVLVNGARVAGERTLADGDLVQMGPVTVALDDAVTRYLGELARAPVELVAAAPETPPAAAAAPRAAPERRNPGERLPRRARIASIVAVSVLVLLAAAASVLVLGGRMKGL
jgi:pSer/pThr/pTyr-binding forkhead associated (FHA) protein